MVFCFYLSTRITVFISVVYYLSDTYPTVRLVFVRTFLRIIFRSHATTSDDVDDSPNKRRHRLSVYYAISSIIFPSHDFIRTVGKRNGIGTDTLPRFQRIGNAFDTLVLYEKQKRLLRLSVFRV